MHGEAVLEAVHAARVLGDVAADRAGDLRRRIGRVVETVAARPLREIARLRTPGCTTAVRASGSIARMRLELGERQQHAVAMRQRAAGESVPAPRATTGTRAAWQRSRIATTCASFSGSATAAGSSRIHREAVALVGPRVLRRGQERRRRQDRGELGVDERDRASDGEPSGVARAAGRLVGPC